MTKEQVLKLLREGIRNLETSTSGLSLEEAKRKYNLTEIIKLASNENPLGPSPKAIEAGKQMAEQMNIYPDPPALELRSVIAEIRGVKPDQVLHGNGSSELITFIGNTFINQGDECIIPTPTYHRYQEIGEIMGGKNILVPLKNYRIDLDEMARKISPKTKLLVIVNPNNPTGDIVRRRELEDFMANVGKDRIVVFDEAYGEYADDEDYPRTLDYVAQGYAVIILHTFSKVYGLAGARIGYALSSPEIIHFLNSVRPTFNMNRFALAVGVAALRDREYFDQCTNLVWEEKKYYYEAFKSLGLFYLPTQSNFIFVRTGADDLKVHEAMTRQGVVIRPMTPWGYKGFIRITIGTHYQNEKVIASLKNALQALKA